MNIANPNVSLLLPTALGTKSKFLGKFCTGWSGWSCPPPSASLQPPASQPSCNHPEVCAGWVWNAAPHPLLPAFHSRLRTRVTGVPRYIPYSTCPAELIKHSFVALLNLAHISIMAPYFGVMHPTTDFPISLTEEEAHRDLVSFSFTSPVYGTWYQYMIHSRFQNAEWAKKSMAWN